MEGLFTLLVLAIVMATTSFVVGSLPLAFKLSPSQLRFISSIGMGVLVGTSLIVIIPEGVETLYSAYAVVAGPKDLHSRSMQDGRWQQEARASPVMQPSIQSRILQGSTAPTIRMETTRSESEVLKDALDVSSDAGATPEILHKRDTGEDDETSSPDITDIVHEEQGSPHAWIGVALISGFIVMYLIDKLPELAAPSKNERTPYHISLDNLGSGLRRGSTSREDGLLEPGGHSKRSHSFATTIGLVIHAAADGIALGASTSNTGLSFIIFLAIMVHKAPASFGLTSVLLKQGLSGRTARAHLLVFSLAAPVGALATFLLVQLLGSGADTDEPTSQWRTGMLLLFSAGTFLYVAMHTMQDNGPNSTGQANGYAESRDSLATPNKPLRDLGASVVGMILPLFLQIGHAH